MKRRWLLPLLLLACMACSNDDDPIATAPPDRGKPSVTLLATVNGLGDNGYNDCMLEGIFAFYEQTGVVVRLLLPADMAEAETMYRQWLAANATVDSAVIIVSGAPYEPMVSSTVPQLRGDGSRVLLTESRAAISGVSTVGINRYGVSYLAGAMMGDFPVLVVAAAPNVAGVEEAIKGFADGHAAHVREGAAVSVDYLARDLTAFAMPDSAYRYMARRMEQLTAVVDNEAVFPLLGGSYVGVQQAMTDNRLNAKLLVGMDADRSGQGNNIPFSVVVHIDRIVGTYLNDWRQGRPWTATATMGLAQQTTEIVIDSKFEPSALMRTYAPVEVTAQAWQQRHDALKAEAAEAEKKMN